MISITDASVDGVSGLTSLLLGLAALGPGFIMLSLRISFITGRLPSAPHAVLTFLTATAMYYAFAVPLLYLSLGVTPLALGLLFFVGPVLVGVSAGAIYQYGLAKWMWKKIGLKPVHPAPTGWDYAFSDRELGERWVRVLLKDGTKVHGFFGERSLASSELGYRDLYLQRVCGDKFSDLEEGRRVSMWISEEEIAMVEFISVNEASR